MAAAFLGVREGDAVPSSVLLDLFARIGPARNATTATSTTSTGHPIAVTLCGARPPVLSHFSVDSAACPEPDGLSLAPKVVSTDADLVLLRVPVSPYGWRYQMFSDYFVYKVRPRRPTLDLLPKSAPHYFGDEEIAVLSCAGDGEYAVAALEHRGMFSFKLHLYRSGPAGEPGSWASRRADEEQMLRDATPTSSEMLTYHQTTKVITLGGAKGTVGWVDLWRGILLCDVLDESPAPTLRDMPLPLPVKGDWRTLFIECCPYYLRDIAVNERKDAIKYVEVKQLVDDTWKATTWSMPIPAISWSDWRQRCSVRSESIGVPVDVARHYKLLHKFLTVRAHKAAEGALSLGRLRMALPTMGVADEDDDVVYMLGAEGTSDGAMATVLAVDLGTQALRGVSKLKRHRLGFTRGFLVTGVSKHLRATAAAGTSDEFGQTEVQDSNVCDQESERESEFD